MINGLIYINGDQQGVIECEQKVKDFVDKLTSSCLTTMLSTNITNNLCPVCASDFDSPYSLEQCGHTFCRLCLIAYFDTHFNATMSLDAFKMSCPYQQCNKICLISDIASLLGSEKMARLATIAFQIYIRQPDNDLVQCMGNDCRQVQ